MIHFSIEAPPLPKAEEYTVGEVIDTGNNRDFPKSFDYVYCLSLDGTVSVLGTIWCEGWNEHSVDFLNNGNTSCYDLIFESHEPFKEEANRGKSFIRHCGKLIEVKIYKANKICSV